MKNLTTKQITTLVKSNERVMEWNPYFTFNDKLKNNRRKLKFMTNGWSVPEEWKIEIVEQLTKTFEDTNVESVKFRVGDGERGSYDYLEIIKQE